MRLASYQIRKIIHLMAPVICLIASNAFAAGKITHLICTTSSDGKTYTNEYVLNESHSTVSMGTRTTKATFGSREVSWVNSSGDGHEGMGISFVTRYKINRIDLSFEETFISIDPGDVRLGMAPSTHERKSTGKCSLAIPPKGAKF